MKSPWKLLVELTTGRRKESPLKGLIADNSGSQSTGITQSDRVALLPAPAVVDAKADKTGSNSAAGPAIEADVTSDVDQAADVETVEARSPVAVSPPGAVADAPTSERGTLAESQSTPRGKRQARVKRASSEVIAQDAKNPNQEQHPLPIKPFFDEVADLDEEIKQLKLSLARKLHLQNAQLKKLLQRFDAR